ncbi:MAG: NAD-dependent epimerase/dehydratase family protein, partial [Proteobacteria bacterium]|nr:NAD-dependent epimerase/dehydratase family protein [Pseudomonadota bacterium]
MSGVKPRKAFITGGAGFIGSTVTAGLLEMGWQVSVFDNLSLGRKEFVEPHLDNPSFRFVEADLLDLERLKGEIEGHDVVFHLSANSDISYGTKYTDIDLKQGTVATYNVLEAMRLGGVGEIIFASSSAIYGETAVVPTPEECGPLFPISFYGASKMACEGLVSAFCHNYDYKAWIYRFGNIVGYNGTHGVIYDFINKLKKNPQELQVLGDGRQAKPYLYVKE